MNFKSCSSKNPFGSLYASKALQTQSYLSLSLNELHFPLEYNFFYFLLLFLLLLSDINIVILMINSIYLVTSFNFSQTFTIAQVSSSQ